MQNKRTPLYNWPDTCQRRGARKNGSEQCTRACLISIWGCEPSAEPCEGRMDCFKIGGLLRSSKWTDSFAELARHLPKVRCMSKWVRAVYQSMFDRNLGPCTQCSTVQRRNGLLQNRWTASKWMDSFAGLARPLPNARCASKWVTTVY
jgi:hypothetical protein